WQIFASSLVPFLACKRRPPRRAVFPERAWAKHSAVSFVAVRRAGFGEQTHCRKTGFQKVCAIRVFPFSRANGGRGATSPAPGPVSPPAGAGPAVAGGGAVPATNPLSKLRSDRRFWKMTGADHAEKRPGLSHRRCSTGRRSGENEGPATTTDP